MYYMIHATDHPEGPKQMSRAYRNTVLPLEPIEQLRLELFPETKAPSSDVPPSHPRENEAHNTRITSATCSPEASVIYNCIVVVSHAGRASCWRSQFRLYPLTAKCELVIHIPGACNDLFIL